MVDFKSQQWSLKLVGLITWISNSHQGIKELEVLNLFLRQLNKSL